MITGWESPEVLCSSLADSVHRYERRIDDETLRVGRPGHEVTVLIGADGFLVAVTIAERARRRRTPAEVAAVVADAVRRAERAAAERRRTLAESFEEW